MFPSTISLDPSLLSVPFPLIRFDTVCDPVRLNSKIPLLTMLPVPRLPVLPPLPT